MSEVLIQAVESILSLFLMGLLGFVLDKRGWIGDEVRIFIPRLVVFVTLPLFLFGTSFRVFTPDNMAFLFSGAALAALSVILCYSLSFLISRLISIKKGRRGLFCVGFTFSNTMFLGVPINLSLFGEISLPYTMAYFCANSLLFWTIGNYFMSLDGPGTKKPILSLDTLKKLLSPPLIGFAIGLILIHLNLRPPSFILTTATAMGALTTPLAVMFIGIGLAGIKFSKLKIDRDIYLLLIGRFIISPLTILIIILLSNMPTLMGQVFIIQSSLPVVTACTLMSVYYHSDTEYASLIVSLTTLLTILTVPIFRILVSFLG